MLRLVAGQAETLWDEALPIEVRELPEDLAALDVLLDDPALLAPITELWRREVRETGRSVLVDGRPTIAMETYVRLMVLKHRHGWGYRTLVAEVSDSIHLRRFCRIALSDRVPDESTVRKLTRRIGPETVDEVTRALISKATREQRLRARAVRVDSTVIEADIKYPTDAGLAAHGVAGAGRGGSQGRREDRPDPDTGARSLALDGPAAAGDLQDDPPALGRSEGRGPRADRADRPAAGPVGARGPAAGGDGPRQGARARHEVQAGRGRQAGGAGRSLREGRRADHPQGGRRADTDRLISLADPDARPIRKGKLGKPNEFGYVAQIAEVTDHTKRGARGLILPAACLPGNAHEDTLLPQTAAELTRLGLKVREVALDGGFTLAASTDSLSELAPERVFISGRQQPGSRRTQRRLQRYRTGAEGRISHLKRGYGLRRSRLKGHDGQKTTTGWGILAYNLDTLAIRTS